MRHALVGRMCVQELVRTKQDIGKQSLENTLTKHSVTLGEILDSLSSIWLAKVAQGLEFGVVASVTFETWKPLCENATVQSCVSVGTTGSCPVLLLVVVLLRGNDGPEFPK